MSEITTIFLTGASEMKRMNVARIEEESTKNLFSFWLLRASQVTNEGSATSKMRTLAIKMKNDSGPNEMGIRNRGHF
jgi:hypothetical protein